MIYELSPFDQTIIYVMCGITGFLNQFVLLRYIMMVIRTGKVEELKLRTIFPLMTAAADVVLLQLDLGPAFLAATGIALILDVALFRFGSR